LAEKLHALGEALADKAVTPIYATCCAFVGDRGFLHPELTHSATEEEVAELVTKKFDRYICSNRTCEIGMNLVTGKDNRSVIFLLEELTRAYKHAR
jgi:D-lactate dehydrogenase